MCDYYIKTMVYYIIGLTLTGSLNPELVGQCNDGRLVNDAETERHLKMSVVPERMNGCVFNFCTRVTEPYMEPGCKEGLEMEMMHILKSVLQFKVS